MFEQYDTPPHQVGIIDFTHGLNGPQEVATFFAPDALEQAVEFSDLLMLVAPPEDWLCRHQNQLVKANACVVLSEQPADQSSLKTIQVKNDGAYRNCVFDLIESINKPSLVGVDLMDLLTVISKGENIHFYESPYTDAAEIDESYLSTHFQGIENLGEVKGIYIVASLSIEHANRMEDFETIIRFFDERILTQPTVAYAARFTIDEPGTRASVLIVT
ncbi:hypothetical protein C7I36_06320 [Zobellella taiwanensis]|uniref:Uncharacterized protein n=1 Tax=Zobellella taiwanensis TaxID=347535 RepID=A0A2P7R4C2_9GAMM|nr:hypothetical protein [Zobellella taiwanensis]PSJ45072.1 hypothetical protein C7I36_06320 [Zobellella taiwanensis]